jgi:hypothetical protein
VGEVVGRRARISPRNPLATSTSRPNRRNNRRLTAARLTPTVTSCRDGRPPRPAGHRFLAGKRSRASHQHPRPQRLCRLQGGERVRP